MKKVLLLTCGLLTGAWSYAQVQHVTIVTHESVCFNEVEVAPGVIQTGDPKSLEANNPNTGIKFVRSEDGKAAEFHYLNSDSTAEVGLDVKTHGKYVQVDLSKFTLPATYKVIYKDSGKLLAQGEVSNEKKPIASFALAAVEGKKTKLIVENVFKTVINGLEVSQVAQQKFKPRIVRSCVRQVGKAN